MDEGIEIRVVVDGPVAVYRQIVDGVRALCVAGKLEPGMKLPTVRDMAGELGVHFNTVAQAYRVLEAEGWVHIAGRRGVLVQYRDRPEAPDELAQTREVSRLRHLVAELQGKGFGREWILAAVAGALEVQS